MQARVTIEIPLTDVGKYKDVTLDYKHETEEYHTSVDAEKIVAAYVQHTEVFEYLVEVLDYCLSDAAYVIDGKHWKIYDYLSEAAKDVYNEETMGTFAEFEADSITPYIPLSDDEMKEYWYEYILECSDYHWSEPYGETIYRVERGCQR